MTLNRKYVPAIGKRIMLASFHDYTSRQLPVWSWWTVREYLANDTVRCEHYNAGDTGEFQEFPLSIIASPIGWQPRYTIYCKPEQVEQVLSWFARGIVVRQSHNLSGSMPTAFQPMDNATAPHWQFPEVTDAVPADECRKVFRVVKVECEELNHYANPSHPDVRAMGRSKRAKLFKEWAKQRWQTEYIPYGGGFWQRTRETVVQDWQE